MKRPVSSWASFAARGGLIFRSPILRRRLESVGRGSGRSVDCAARLAARL
jgi:hypothetical protein